MPSPPSLVGAVQVKLHDLLVMSPTLSPSGLEGLSQGSRVTTGLEAGLGSAMEERGLNVDLVWFNFLNVFKCFVKQIESNHPARFCFRLWFWTGTILLVSGCWPWERCHWPGMRSDAPSRVWTGSFAPRGTLWLDFHRRPAEDSRWEPMNPWTTRSLQVPQLAMEDLEKKHVQPSGGVHVFEEEEETHDVDF